MGFYEDDRIRKKQKLVDRSVNKYNLIVKEGIDIKNIAWALAECGFDVTVDGNSIVIKD
jgi:hypothetical protein